MKAAVLKDYVESCVRRIQRGGWAEDAKLRRCAFPIGPRNTWSNLGYVIAGVLMPTLIGSPFSWVMGFSLIALGVGSGLYHGFKTPFTNMLDWTGMYLCIVTLMLHGYAPHAHPAAAAFALAFAIWMSNVFAYKTKHFDWHMGVGFLVAAVPVALDGQWGNTLIVTALFGTAYLAWQLDRIREVVGLWGHAIWHVLTAIAMAWLFAAQAGVV